MSTATLERPAPARAPQHAEPDPAPAGTFGEIISWELPAGATIPYALLSEALRDHGLDESALKRRLPRNAFARACRDLAEARVIRRVREDSDHIWFQFTKEERTEDDACPLAYAKEAIVRLAKQSGDLESDLPEVTQAARLLFDQHMATYTVSDVSDVVQRLFGRAAGLPGAGLFPIKRNSGVYFVPRELAGFLEGIDAFVKAVGGELTRLPVHRGDPRSARAVRDAVAEGLRQLVAEYGQAVDDFGDGTQEATLQRHAERIDVARFKIEGYADYLEDKKAELLAGLAAVTAKLKARMASLGD